MKNNKVLILSGGSIDTHLLLQMREKNDFAHTIVVDGGLVTAHKEKMDIDYLVGDFDTAPKELVEEYKRRSKEPDCPFRFQEYIPEKDYTDTEIALSLAIQLNPDEIIMIGCLGTRLDHSISNIQTLKKALHAGVKAYIIDLHNKIYLAEGTLDFQRDSLYGDYISLLPFTDTVEGITLSGFKYPLTEKTIHKGVGLGISNEIVSEQASLTLSKGILLVIESKD